MHSNAPEPLRIRRSHTPPTPAVRRRELWAWMMFDFANSGYTTVVITAVFSAYFVATVAGNADWATFAWTAALSLSYALILISAPVLGAWADLRAGKRSLLWWTTGLCVLGTAALAWTGPGSVVLALVLIVLTNTAYGTGENVIAAFLPELAREEAMGRLSGYGWAVGYLGGLAILAVCLWWITGAEARGSDTVAAVQQSMLFTALAFALAALPTLLLLRERARPQPLPPGGALLATAFSRVRESLLGWLLAIGLFWFSESRAVVWAAANVAGLCMGASQSVGRALVGVLCPPAREAEIFGLWGLAVKLASILGPLSYGAVSWISGGDHRTAMLCTALFFIAGLAILASIDIERGRAARGLA